MKTLLLIFIMIGIFPLLLRANGGDQRVVEQKYLINLSRSPFTPRIEEKTVFLVSFVDIQENKLIAKDLVLTIRIAKLGGSGGKRTFLFEEKNIRVKGGIHEFSYVFPTSGLHEIFFDFALASKPDTTYEAPDFLLDVQETKEFETALMAMAGIGLLGILLGLGSGFWFNRFFRRE